MTVPIPFLLLVHGLLLTGSGPLSCHLQACMPEFFPTTTCFSTTTTFRRPSGMIWRVTGARFTSWALNLLHLLLTGWEEVEGPAAASSSPPPSSSSSSSSIPLAASSPMPGHRVREARGESIIPPPPRIWWRGSLNLGDQVRRRRRRRLRVMRGLSRACCCSGLLAGPMTAF